MKPTKKDQHNYSFDIEDIIQGFQMDQYYPPLDHLCSQPINQDDKHENMFKKTSSIQGNQDLFMEESEWYLPFQRISSSSLNPIFDIQDVPVLSATPSLKLQPQEKQSPISEKQSSKKKRTFKPRDQKIAAKKQKTNSSRSETKNVPKNYCKAIISFVKHNPGQVEKALIFIGSPYRHEEIHNYLKQKKKQSSISKIEDLRKLWIGHQYEKEMRVITEYFLRKHCHSWVFNSRVENHSVMLKYKVRISEGVKNPSTFKHMKLD